MWLEAWLAEPESVGRFFSWLASSTESASHARLRARAFGKSSSCPSAAEVRVVIPMPATMQILDALLAQAVDAMLTPPSLQEHGWFVGARPRTQILDITFGLSQVIELACDDYSRGAIAQCDIRAFYDTIDMLLVGRWLLNLVSSERDRAVVAALVRWQLLPSVLADAEVTEFLVVGRTMGCLTGSRGACVCGCTPVEMWSFTAGVACRLWGIAWVMTGLGRGQAMLTICFFRVTLSAGLCRLPPSWRLHCSNGGV